VRSLYPRSEYVVSAFTKPASTRIASVADLGAAIRARRQEAKLTLAIAAPTCGVSVKFLQALETGKATIQFDKALGVARHFGIQLAIA
jgi:HTH-type transcriptional regulator / antitoxin HipB